MISLGAYSVPEPLRRFDVQLRRAAHLLLGSLLQLMSLPLILASPWWRQSTWNQSGTLLPTEWKPPFCWLFVPYPCCCCHATRTSVPGASLLSSIPELFWFAEMTPELEKPDSDIYQLMRQLGKKPTWCTETIDIVQASSKERVMFGLSPDDPSALLKILRRSFDDQGTPLDVQFLTDRGDMYRLHYSFPLFEEGIPEAVREKVQEAPQ